MGDAKKGVEIAKAFVTVIPSLRGAKKILSPEIKEALGGSTEKAADEAGKKGGKRLGKGLALKASATIAALGLGKMLAEGLAQGMDLEKAQGRMTAQLALTADESEKAGRVAGGLWASAYGDNAGEAGDAVAAVMSSIRGMRGASEADLQALTGRAMSLASAFDLDVSQAASAAGQMVEKGLARDGAEALDLLTVSLQKVPAEMRGDIVDAANEYGGYLKDMGYTGEQAMGMLVAASASGSIAIDKTGDVMKEFTNLVGSDQSQKVFEDLGLNAKKMSNDVKAGGTTATGAIKQIAESLLKIEDPTERANAAITLFGTPLEDIGVAKIPTFLEGLSGMDGALGNVSGAAASLDTQLNQNTATSLETVKRTFIQVAVEGIQPFLEAAQPMLAWMTENPAVIQAVAVALGVLAVGLTIAAAAQWAMNSGLLACPITWIILAVVALVAAIVWLVANWEWVSQQAVVIWGAIVEFFQWLWDTIVAVAKFTWDAITAWLQQKWNESVLAAQIIWGAIVGFFQGLWDNIVMVIQVTWDAITGWLKGVWETNVQAAQIIWSRLTGFFRNLWNGIKTTATSLWNALVGFIRGIPGRVMAGLAALNRLAGQARQWFQGFVQAAQDKFNGIVTWVRGIPQKIMSALGNLSSLLLQSGRNLVGGFLDGIKGAWGTLTDWVSRGMETLRGLWPFSPAKWGPFAGRGYVTYSGDALTGDFADSIRGGIPLVASAAEALMSAVAAPAASVHAPAPILTAPASASGPAPQGGSVTYNVYNPVAEPTSRTVQRESRHMALGVA